MRKGLRRDLKKLGFFMLGGFLGVLVFGVVGFFSFKGKILPNVYVGKVWVGGLEVEEAEKRVRDAVSEMEVLVFYGEYDFRIEGEDFGYDVDEVVKDAYKKGRDFRELGRLLSRGVRVEGRFENDFEEFVASVSSSVKLKPVRATIEYEDGEIVIENGQDGVEVEKEELDKKIREYGESLESGRFELPTKAINGALSEEERESLRKKGESLKGESLRIRFEKNVFELKTEELVGFLAVLSDEGEVVSEEKVKNYVEGLSSSVEREAVNARFQFENGRVREFVPDRKGVRVVREESEKRIKDAVLSLVEESEEEEVELAVEYKEPEVTTEEVNEFGIEERIGRGDSYYRHSISSRVYNVELAARKLDGVLIEPGEIFSFNGELGEVSAATGFKSAYIIKDGRTVLGDGGGVCQDSTTFFRAALDAGLPIVERWAHGYRVTYYEQNAKPGLDATVYAPSKDLKFKNDTGSYILIDTWYDSARRYLVVDIYGKDDGRVVNISPVRVWGVTPPPPPLYQDDPSLPKGEVKQVDWAAWGAKTEFDYEVKRGGEVVQSKSFYSNFVPWQDVYLRGTGE